jgi:hypothetical protein
MRSGRSPCEAAVDESNCREILKVAHGIGPAKSPGRFMRRIVKLPFSFFRVGLPAGLASAQVEANPATTKRVIKRWETGK